MRGDLVIAARYRHVGAHSVRAAATGASRPASAEAARSTRSTRSAKSTLRTLRTLCTMAPGQAREQVRKIDIVEVHVAAAKLRLPSGRRLEVLAGMLRAELVVRGALFRIAQCLVRLRDFLELGFAFGILRHVRVILVRELPVRLLDRVLVGAAVDAEDLVVVLVFHDVSFAMEAITDCPSRARQSAPSRSQRIA